MNEPIYYLNGEFVAASAAALPLNDLGLLRGFGVFDFLRSYNGVPFKLHEHVLRLERSATAIGLALPATPAEIEAIALETFRRNGLANAGIRIVVTGGASDNSMTPSAASTLAVMISPVKPYSASLFAQGAKAITTTVERFMPTVKSINYIGAIIAMRAAEQAGAVEAIYRTADGLVTEGTRSNFFVFHGDQLLTPGTGVLDGITRQVVLEIAEDDFIVRQASLPYAELAT